MKNLPKHIEKVGFALVFLICSGLLYLQIESGRPDWEQNLKEHADKVEAALKKGKVSSNYPYSAQNAEKNLKFKEVLALNEERVDKIAIDPVPAFVAYLQPSRPTVDQNERPKGVPDIKEVAAMGKVAEVAARGDHGCVFVTCKLVGDTKHMINSHIEIFRGEALDKIDMNKPHGILDVTPIEAAEPEKKEDKKEESGRRPRNRGDDPAPAAGGTKSDEVPAELASLHVFGDTQVEPKKTYFYRARLVARVAGEIDKRIEQKDNTGTLRHYLIITAPEGVQTTSAPEGGEAGAYFASDLSEPVSATPPANFEFWLSGIIGEVSAPGTELARVRHDYQGRFSLRVWVPTANKWVSTPVMIGEGQKLTGKISYKDAEGKPVTVEFDTGYKLIEIVWGDRPVESKGGVKNVQTEKAIMEEIATKKREEHWKGGSDADRKSREMEGLRLKMEKERKARELAKKKKGAKPEPKK